MTAPDLEDFPLFKNLSPQELSKLSSILISKDFTLGSLIIKQDDTSDFFYMIREGSVRVFRTVENGTEIDIAQLKKGSFFGEMAILDGSRRSVNVKTLEDSSFLMLSRENFLNELWKFPDLILKLLQSLSVRIRKTDEKFITDLMEKNVSLEIANNELKKIDVMKSKFFALASHELRTPIGVLLMALPLLEKRPRSKPSKKNPSIAKMIESQILRLSDAITAILKVSDSQEPIPGAGTTQGNLNELLSSALLDLSSFFSVRNLRLIEDLDPTLPDIPLDKSKFYQIIINLTMNAIRFTPDGGTISVRTWKNGPVLFLSVTDTGIGIEKKHLKDIYKPFYIIQDELKHSSGTYQFMAGGLGLGLTIAKKFVEYHNGNIDVVSRKGSGSTFTVTIPIPSPERRAMGVT